MPLRELQRLQTVHRFLTLHLNKERELQQLVDLAAVIFEVATVLITFEQKDQYEFLFRHGTEMSRISKQDSFCRFIDQTQGILVVPDAWLDERFRDHPLVSSGPHTRFYAGAALSTHDGYQLGTLCLLNSEPKQLAPGQAELLQLMARQVLQILEFDFSVNILKELYIETKTAENKLCSFLKAPEPIICYWVRKWKPLPITRSWRTLSGKCMMSNCSRASK